MNETNGTPPAPDADPVSEGGLRAPPGLSYWGRVRWWFHFAVLVKLARLRFVAVLFAIGATIVYWDTFKAYYDKWTRPANAHESAAASGLEWFCPMHPQIVRDNPKDKCPICFMPLSKRRKGAGDDDPLPAGTISRVQLSPYRVALAGVQTFEVNYRPLSVDVVAAGTVEFDERRLSRITVRAGGKSRIDKLYVNVTGQAVKPGDPLALVYSPELTTTAQNLIDAHRSGNADLARIAEDRLRLWGIDAVQIAEIRRTARPVTHLTVRAPSGGQVIRKYQVEGEYVDEGARLYDLADLSHVWVEAQVYETQIALVQEGLPVAASTVAYPDREFAGRVALIQPHLDPGTRTVRVRFDIDNAGGELRPGMFATVRLHRPVAETDQFARAAVDGWRDATAIVSSLAPGDPAAMLAMLVRTAADEAVRRQGLVLAVPEGSVIDTGSRKVVYREASPGVYEGVEVWLGPRSDAYYPVVRGLAQGDRVVTTGSFLIDAETRLNPAAGSIYIGGSSGSKSGGSVTARPSGGSDEDAEITASLAKLSAADRKAAQEQRLCPVLGTRLGSMGTPVKVTLEGRLVFLCCAGCEARAKANPAEMLQRVDRVNAEPATVGPDQLSAEEEKEIAAALAGLSSGDRKLAESQRSCPISDGSRLGSMGTPYKIDVNGRPVFLCCEGCRERAQADPAKTLAQVDKFRAAHRAGVKP